MNLKKSILKTLNLVLILSTTVAIAAFIYSSIPVWFDYPCDVYESAFHETFRSIFVVSLLISIFICLVSFGIKIGQKQHKKALLFGLVFLSLIGLGFGFLSVHVLNCWEFQIDGPLYFDWGPH